MSNDTTSRDVKDAINPVDYYSSRVQDFKPNRPGWQNVRCVFHGDNTPSLAINSETGGYLCFGCGAKGGDIISFEMALNHCSFADAIQTLKNFAGMPDYAKRIPVKPTPRREGDVAKLKRLWTHAAPLDNLQCAEIARKYLCFRGLVSVLDDLPNDLRTSYLEYWHKGELDEKAKLKGTYASLLAVVRDAAGYPVCLHRTYLSDTGEGQAYVNAPKKLTSTIRDPKGAAIKLYTPTTELAIAEGLETALSVRVATGIPVWGAVSTGLMISVAVPDSVKRVWVCADNDENGAGESAAIKLVSRLLREGKDARLVMPSEIDSDWNDVLLGGQANG